MHSYIWSRNNTLKWAPFGIPLAKKARTYYPFICDVQKVEKLKALCLQYATSIQLLIPSIEVAAPESKSKSGSSRARAKRSQDRDEQLKLASENVVMSQSILYVSRCPSQSILQSLVPTQFRIVTHHLALSAAGNSSRSSTRSSRASLLR